MSSCNESSPCVCRTPGLIGSVDGLSSSSPSVSLNLLGEFSLWKPAYLRVASPQAGAPPSLYVSQFSLTGQGSVTRVDLFGSDKRSQDVKIKPLLHNFMWPNEVLDVKPGTITGATEDSLLVADGFLMPGRSDGGLYVVQNPGRSTEKVSSRSGRWPATLPLLGLENGCLLCFGCTDYHGRW